MQADGGRLTPDPQVVKGSCRMHDGQKRFGPEPLLSRQAFRSTGFPNVSCHFAIETDDHAVTCYIIPLNVIIQAKILIGV